MATHLVTYDLNAPGRDYTALYDAIKTATYWAHPVESVWLIVTDLTPVEVRDNLTAIMDANDRLMVINVTSDAAAWIGIPTNVSNWIQQHL